MSQVMQYIKVKDFEKLKSILESPEMYPIYRKFVPNDVTHAEVGMYEHDGGVLIEGRPGRWWLYIRLYYGDENIYDLALWKLGPHLKKLVDEGAIEIVDK